jgi:hypothetical protein
LTRCFGIVGDTERNYREVGMAASMNRFLKPGEKHMTCAIHPLMLKTGKVLRMRLPTHDERKYLLEQVKDDKLSLFLADKSLKEKLVWGLEQELIE